MSRIQLPVVKSKRRPWKKGRLIGQKRPLLPKQVWAIRARLELAGNLRDLALFNLAIDSKLRGCDLVRLKVVELVSNDRIRERASIIQSKTNRPVQFEVSESTRDSLWKWLCTQKCSDAASCSRAGSMSDHMFRRGSMDVWSRTGCRRLASIQVGMAPIRCDAQRQRSSTAKLVTCGPSNSYSDTPRLTAQCGILVSSLKTR